jgi:hypothetical protein
MKRYLFTIILAFIASFIFAQVRIDTPALVAPADAKTNQMPDVMLDWNAVTAAVSYRVQLSEDASFSNIVVDSVTDLTSIKNSKLNFNFQYYWRVKALDLNLNESFWTPVWSFTTFQKLEPDKPNNNATAQIPDVQLKWKTKVGTSNVSGVEHFDIQIDVNANFTSPNAKTFLVSGSTFAVTMSQLNFGTLYYWHARARHSNDTSAWSDSRTFTTLDNFSLKKPDNNSVGNDLNVQMRWDDVSGVKKYDYQIDIHPDFSTATTYVTDTFRVTPEDLKYGVTYYWRSRARHDNDTTLWTATWNYTTAASVALALPENNADSVSIKPQLTWSQIKGSTSYQVQYDVTMDFIEPENYFQTASDDESPLFNVLYKLDANQVYYWRVRACSPIDSSAYSEVWSFTTLPAVGINDELFGSAEVSLFPNPAKTDLRIQLNLTQPSVIEFSIMDLVGQTLIRENLNTSAGLNNFKINLTNLANGIYMVKMKNDNSTYTKKLIINK